MKLHNYYINLAAYMIVATCSTHALTGQQVSNKSLSHTPSIIQLLPLPSNFKSEYPLNEGSNNGKHIVGFSESRPIRPVDIEPNAATTMDDNLIQKSLAPFTTDLQKIGQSYEDLYLVLYPKGIGNIAAKLADQDEKYLTLDNWKEKISKILRVPHLYENFQPLRLYLGHVEASSAQQQSAAQQEQPMIRFTTLPKSFESEFPLDDGSSRVIGFDSPENSIDISLEQAQGITGEELHRNILTNLAVNEKDIRSLRFVLSPNTIPFLDKSGTQISERVISLEDWNKIRDNLSSAKGIIPNLRRNAAAPIEIFIGKISQQRNAQAQSPEAKSEHKQELQSELQGLVGSIKNEDKSDRILPTYTLSYQKLDKGYRNGFISKNVQYTPLRHQYIEQILSEIPAVHLSTIESLQNYINAKIPYGLGGATRTILKFRPDGGFKIITDSPLQELQKIRKEGGALAIFEAMPTSKIAQPAPKPQSKPADLRDVPQEQEPKQQSKPLRRTYDISFNNVPKRYYSFPANGATHYLIGEPFLQEIPYYALNTEEALKAYVTNKRTHTRPGSTLTIMKVHPGKGVRKLKASPLEELQKAQEEGGSIAIYDSFPIKK